MFDLWNINSYVLYAEDLFWFFYSINTPLHRKSITTHKADPEAPFTSDSFYSLGNLVSLALALSKAL